MTDRPLISVIIPVYNTAEYLPKCFDSVLNQTWGHIELIIVDDGSTDNSAQIIRTYEAKYPEKVKTIFQQNGGQASARNAALDMMSGDYVAFVDSDDWVLPEMLEELLASSIETDSDIVISDFQTENELGEVTGNYSSGQVSLSGEEVSQRPEKLAAIVPQVTGKLFNSSLFDNQVLRFPCGIWYEDLALIPLIVLSANRISKVDKYFYRYFKREGSTTTSFSIKVLDALKALDFIQLKLERIGRYRWSVMKLVISRACYITAIRGCEIHTYQDRVYCFRELARYIWKNNTLLLTLKGVPLSETLIHIIISCRVGMLLYFMKTLKKNLRK